MDTYAHTYNNNNNIFHFYKYNCLTVVDHVHVPQPSSSSECYFKFLKEAIVVSSTYHSAGEEAQVEVGGPGLHYLCSLPLLQDVITDWEPALTSLPGRDQVSVVEVTTCKYFLQHLIWNVLNDGHYIYVDIMKRFAICNF